MRVEDIKDIHDAFHVVLKHCKDPYAKIYAEAGLHLWSAEELREQIPYVLSNTASWRGSMARGIKSFLKDCLKETTR